MVDGASRIFANLGCGPKGAGRPPPSLEQWRELRVDANAAVEPDVVADLTDLSPIPTGSVHGIWAAHCVEHLYRHQVRLALSEMCRILSPDGFACILVPDLQTVAAYVASDKMDEPLYISPAGPIAPHDILFGLGSDIAVGNTFMAHKCGFTPSALMAEMNAAGFGQFIVLRRPNFELAALAHRTGWRSEAERNDLVDRLRL
jgi:hypothetical protein